MLKKHSGPIRKIMGRLSSGSDTENVDVPAPEYHFNLDYPQYGPQPTTRMKVSGWLIPIGETNVKALRLRNGDLVIAIPYGKDRPDLPGVFPNIEPEKTRKSGFSKTINFVDGPLLVEADFGHGFQTLKSITVSFSPEMLTEMLHNPQLGWNWAEHQNLLNGKKIYYHEEASSALFERHPDDPQLIAFYLPQFHPIKENNDVWGKGFTEWTNTTTAQARFTGHQQPLLPADLGFYDLRYDGVMEDQIMLAKQHGINAFCFYYYWFSGKKILDRPLKNFLKHTEWDFNFVICWANENWTKRWDGHDNEIIIAQQYSENDPLNFIRDVENILLDPRYLTIAGKPVLIVYRVSSLDNGALYADIWRKYMKKTHDKDIYLISVLGFDLDDPRDYGFDAGLDFNPLTAVLNKTIFPKGELPLVDIKNKLLDINFEGGIVDYRQVALHPKIRANYDFPVYRSVMPSWDNEARKKGKGASFHLTSPDIYARWLDDTLGSIDNRNPPLVFINAWNEWAEGAMLEPSLHLGHAMLNRTSEVLAKHSNNPQNITSFPQFGFKREKETKLAVIVHVFYEREWRYIEKKLNLIEGNFDLFVTLTAKHEVLAQEIKQSHPGSWVKLVPNRGRDMLPFFWLMQRLRTAGYEHVLKLHTKRSLHRRDGFDWFKDLIDKLLPSKDKVMKIVQALDSGTSLIGPTGHFVSLRAYLGSNEPNMKSLLLRAVGAKETEQILQQADKYGYFAGSMFWMRSECINPLLDLYLLPEDFEPEVGQIDGTIAHALERSISLMPMINNNPLLQSNLHGLKQIKEDDIIEEYRYA